jgi:hypothetical protein
MTAHHNFKEQARERLTYSTIARFAGNANAKMQPGFLAASVECQPSLVSCFWSIPTGLNHSALGWPDSERGLPWVTAF